jgi:hypothetical protein
MHAAAVERQAALSHAIKFQSLQTFFFLSSAAFTCGLTEQAKERKKKNTLRALCAYHLPTIDTNL